LHETTLEHEPISSWHLPDVVHPRDPYDVNRLFARLLNARRLVAKIGWLCCVRDRLLNPPEVDFTVPEPFGRPNGFKYDPLFEQLRKNPLDGQFDICENPGEFLTVE